MIAESVIVAAVLVALPDGQVPSCPTRFPPHVLAQITHPELAEQAATQDFTSNAIQSTPMRTAIEAALAQIEEYRRGLESVESQQRAGAGETEESREFKVLMREGILLNQEAIRIFQCIADSRGEELPSFETTGTDPLLGALVPGVDPGTAAAVGQIVGWIAERNADATAEADANMRLAEEYEAGRRRAAQEAFAPTDHEVPSDTLGGWKDLRTSDPDRDDPAPGTEDDWRWDESLPPYCDSDPSTMTTAQRARWTEHCDTDDDYCEGVPRYNAQVVDQMWADYERTKGRMFAFSEGAALTRELLRELEATYEEDYSTALVQTRLRRIGHAISALLPAATATKSVAQAPGVISAARECTTTVRSPGSSASVMLDNVGRARALYNLVQNDAIVGYAQTIAECTVSAISAEAGMLLPLLEAATEANDFKQGMATYRSTVEVQARRLSAQIERSQREVDLAWMQIDQLVTDIRRILDCY